MFYAATHIESQILMCWQPILEYIWPNIKHIAVVENIVSDTISILPYTPVNQYKPSTTMYISWSNELFSTRVEQNINYWYDLVLSGPAVPICGFWCIKRFLDHFYGGFAKLTYFAQNYHWFSLINIPIYWGVTRFGLVPNCSYKSIHIQRWWGWKFTRIRICIRLL